MMLKISSVVLNVLLIDVLKAKRVYYSRMDETGLQVISQPYWVGVNTKFTI